MLSQTKMQLWYPKKSSDDSPNDLVTFQRKSVKTPVDGAPTSSDKSDGTNEEVDVEFLSEDCSGSLGVSDCEEEMEKKRKREDVKVSDFVDLDYWKKETICCGTIFRGMYDEVIVDPRFLKPCKDRLEQRMRVNKTNLEIKS